MRTYGKQINPRTTAILRDLVKLRGTGLKYYECVEFFESTPSNNAK